MPTKAPAKARPKAPPTSRARARTRVADQLSEATDIRTDEVDDDTGDDPLAPVYESELPAGDFADDLGDFGEVEQEELESLDDPPIPFTITGYEANPDPETGVRRPHKFTFLLRPDMSFGKIFSMMQQMDGKGNVPLHVGASFIADALVYEQRDDWLETLARPDIEFHSSSIQTLTQKLAERYGLRPTERPSESPERPQHSGRTTTGVRSARKSGSATSKRRTR